MALLIPPMPSVDARFRIHSMPFSRSMMRRANASNVPLLLSSNRLQISRHSGIGCISHSSVIMTGQPKQCSPSIAWSVKDLPMCDGPKTTPILHVSATMRAPH